LDLFFECQGGLGLLLDLIIEKEFVLLVSRELVGELGDVVVEPLGFVVGETEVCWEERDGGREGGMGEVVSPELVLEMRDGVVEPVGFVVGETEVCWEGRDGGREGGMGEGDLIVEEEFVLFVSPELVMELGDVVVGPVGFVVGETEICVCGGGRQRGRGGGVRGGFRMS